MTQHSYVTFCTKPWEELVVFPNGNYTICCGGPPVGKIRDVLEQEINNLYDKSTDSQF